jgi:hypothetical protein
MRPQIMSSMPIRVSSHATAWLKPLTSLHLRMFFFSVSCSCTGGGVVSIVPSRQSTIADVIEMNRREHRLETGLATPLGRRLDPDGPCGLAQPACKRSLSVFVVIRSKAVGRDGTWRASDRLIQSSRMNHPASNSSRCHPWPSVVVAGLMTSVAMRYDSSLVINWRDLSF